MSVIKSKRNQSDVQFIQTAKDLEEFTLEQCLKFPKRYPFLLTNKIMDYSSSVLDCVTLANNIFPKTKAEASQRRQLFLTARGTLKSMIPQIDIAYKKFPIKDNAMIHWMELIDTELHLITGIMKKDKQRFKDLP